MVRFFAPVFVIRGVVTLVILLAVVVAYALLRPPASTELPEQELGWGEEGADRKLGEGYTDLQRLEEEVQEKDPEVLFVGNSMLDSRVDPQVLDQVAEAPTLVWYRHNTFTPVWDRYLEAVKQAGGTPEVVVLMFRGRELTFPNFRIEGERAIYLKELLQELPSREVAQSSGLDRNDEDGLWGEIQARWERLGEPLPRSLDASPMGRIEEWSEDAVQFRYDSGQLEAGRARRFAYHNIRPELGGEAGDSALEGDMVEVDGFSTQADFDRARDLSLLPEIKRQCDEMGARLVLIHVRTRPDETGETSTPDELYLKYWMELSQWCREQNVILIDQRDDTRWQVADYDEGDHLRHDRRPEWTRSFWRRFGTELEAEVMDNDDPVSAQPNPEERS